MQPPGLHGPGQLPGGPRVLKLLLGDLLLLFLLLQGPPGLHPWATVPQGGITGELIQYGVQRRAWEAAGWENTVQAPASTLKLIPGPSLLLPRTYTLVPASSPPGPQPYPSDPNISALLPGIP